MKIPGLIEFNTDLSHDDIKDCKILNLTFSNANAAGVILELGLIPEINYFQKLFKTIFNELEIEENTNVAIVSPSLKDLIFNLAIVCAINNQNIEYYDQTMYYVNHLRRNTHIIDNSQNFELNIDIVDDEDVFYDDDFNPENYDIDDLED
jgi:hypothetical protein